MSDADGGSIKKERGKKKAEHNGIAAHQQYVCQQITRGAVPLIGAVATCAVVNAFDNKTGCAETAVVGV